MQLDQNQDSQIHTPGMLQLRAEFSSSDVLPQPQAHEGRTWKASLTTSNISSVPPRDLVGQLCAMDTEPLSHTDSVLPPAFLASASSKHQQRDRPVSCLCALWKTPQRNWGILWAFGSEGIGRKEEGGKGRVQKSTKLKQTFLFRPFLFPSKKRERKKDNRERQQLDGQKSQFLFEWFQFSL